MCEFREEAVRGSAGEVGLDPGRCQATMKRLVVRGREKAVNSQESNGLLIVGREKKDGSQLTGSKREKREPEPHGKTFPPVHGN